MNKKIQVLLQPPKKHGLTREEWEQVRTVLNHGRYIFISGAMYQMIINIYTYMLDDRKPPIEFSSLTLSAINTGLELTAVNIVDPISKIYFKPDLSTLGRWMRWTTLTSTASTFALKMIQVPMENYYMTERITWKGFFPNALVSSMRSAGFSIGSGMGQLYLPPEKKVGGSFARDCMVVGMGNLGSTLAGAPSDMIVRNVPFTAIIKNFFNSIPLIILDSGIYSLVRSVSRPLLLGK